MPFKLSGTTRPVVEIDYDAPDEEWEALYRMVERVESQPDRSPWETMKEQRNEESI